MTKPKFNACLCALACALTLFGARAGAQTRRQERGWRRIVPLHSTRAEVLRRLGKAKRGNATFSRYEMPDGQTANIYYSDGKTCAAGAEWRVPAGTVLRILVQPAPTPAPPLRLDDLRLDMRKFKKDAGSGDVHDARTRYVNEDAGVTYEVYEQGGPESAQVMDITYEAAARDKRLRCPQKR